MKLALIIALATAAAVTGVARRKVGPCQPYAEKCEHCSDCSRCRHCHINKGTCSVCAPR